MNRFMIYERMETSSLKFKSPNLTEWVQLYINTYPIITLNSILIWHFDSIWIMQHYQTIEKLTQRIGKHLH